MKDILGKVNKVDSHVAIALGGSGEGFIVHG